MLFKAKMIKYEERLHLNKAVRNKKYVKIIYTDFYCFGQQVINKNAIITRLYRGILFLH